MSSYVTFSQHVSKRHLKRPGWFATSGYNAQWLPDELNLHST